MKTTFSLRRGGVTTQRSRADSVSRREFLRRSALLAAGATLAPNLLTSTAFAAPKALPTPNKSGINHIVVAMMENRSFDHLLGWLPGANGQQAGLNYADANGVLHPTAPLAPNFQGCGHPDPDHSYEGGRVEYNGGACDGWLRAGLNDDFAIGYYTQPDLPFLGAAAPSWLACDRYFAAILAGTYPNRIYQHAAQTDRLDNSILPFSTLPTIWDRLADHSLSRKYYFSDFPFLALWGSRYVNISHLVADFFADCAAGTLPAVSFVEPRFVGEEEGISGDYHPHSDIRNGEVFLNSVYDAVVTSPNWSSTLLVITFDEWGGFFDHVAPTAAPVPSADAALGSDGLRGFRVPALIVSPWSPRGQISSQLFDHTSVLKLIEWRWHLDPLTVRDANANNLANALNFAQPNLSAPRFAIDPGPYGGACPIAAPQTEAELPPEQLLDVAKSLGFPVPS
jgi:phospholipase C